MSNKIKRVDTRKTMNNNTILLLMTVALFAIMYIAGCVVYADKGFARLQSFILRYTKFGRSLYAVGGNQQSAALMGLDVRKTKFKAHVFSSFMASVGSICYVMNTMCGTTRQALGLEMDAIASAVIGGTLLTGGVGNVFGSFIGVLINGTISSLVKTNGKLNSAWPNVITAILLCFFIIVQAIFAKLKNKNKS